MSATLDTFLQDFSVVIDIPVQWGEMDALQHVNNVAYFRYFESARIAYLNRTSLLGPSPIDNNIDGSIRPILAATECRYKWAVSFPDTLKIGCSLIEFHDHGFLQTYAIYSLTQNRVTTQGSGRVVLLNTKTGQKVPLSAKLKAELEAIETARKQSHTQ